MQLSQPTLEPHSLCYTCWVQVVYSLLPTLLFFPCSFWGYSTAAQFLPMRGSSPRATRSMRTSSCSSPSRRPCGAQLPRDFVYVLRFRILCIRHFVINVINNIRNCFIISFVWYVLWYIVHSVVYTCDLTLARIWLLDLCPFINRVLQYVKHMGHNRNRLYSRAIHCLASMEMHYVQWFLLKSVYEITDCAKN